jgi:hypothetical protein
MKFEISLLQIGVTNDIGQSGLRPPGLDSAVAEEPLNHATQIPNSHYGTCTDTHGARVSPNRAHRNFLHGLNLDGRKGEQNLNSLHLGRHYTICYRVDSRNFSVMLFWIGGNDPSFVSYI